MNRRLGVDVRNDLPVQQQIAECEWAEQNGFDDAWLAEITDPEIFSVLGAMTQRSSRIRLGTAIVPLGTRSVPTIASAAATIATLAPGRFCLGVGVSSRVIIEEWHGQTDGPALVRAREAITMLRDLLAGARSHHKGAEFSSLGYTINRPPLTIPTISLAALNPRMLRLAGEIADAVHLNFLPVTAVERALDAIRSGAESAGRAMPEIIMAVPTWVTDDVDEARAALASAMAFYLPAPSYQRALSWYGFDDEVREARARLASGGMSAMRRGISSGMIDAIGALGDIEHVRGRYGQYWSAGLSTLSVSPLGPRTHDTFRAVAGMSSTV